MLFSILESTNEDEEARTGRSGADNILWVKRKREEAGKLVGGEGGDRGRSEWSLGGRCSASYCRRYLGCTWGVPHVVTAGVYSSGK